MVATSLQLGFAPAVSETDTWVNLLLEPFVRGESFLPLSGPIAPRPSPSLAPSSASADPPTLFPAELADVN